MRAKVSVLAGSAVLAIGLLGATATAASAQSATGARSTATTATADTARDMQPLACTHPAWSNKDSDTGHVFASDGDVAVHDGPNSGCAVSFYVDSTVLLQYHCYVRNSAGNTWTHVRADGTEFEGWVWDSYLTDNGSLAEC
ncbi:hypothetical protein [Rugosimonospora africana]|nr:hypothetical protein [Rugosimonospora africana]